MGSEPTYTLNDFKTLMAFADTRFTNESTSRFQTQRSNLHTPEHGILESTTISRKQNQFGMACLLGHCKYPCSEQEVPPIHPFEFICSHSNSLISEASPIYYTSDNDDDFHLEKEHEFQFQITEST